MTRPVIKREPTRVSTFRLSDGTNVVDKADADKQQRALDFVKWYDADPKREMKDARGETIFPETIAAWLEDNAAAALDFLGTHIAPPPTPTPPGPTPTP